MRPCAARSSGTSATPLFHRVSRCFHVDRDSEEQHTTTLQRVHTANCSNQLRFPCSDQPGDANDLTGPHHEAYILEDAGPTRALDLEPQDRRC